jgi:hypothetical protein
MSIIKRVSGFFSVDKTPEVCPHLEELNESLDNNKLITLLGSLTTTGNNLIEQTSTNVLTSFLTSLNALSKLKIDGDHTCFLYGLHLKLTYNKGALINIELEEY